MVTNVLREYDTERDREDGSNSILHSFVLCLVSDLSPKSVISLCSPVFLDCSLSLQSIPLVGNQLCPYPWWEHQVEKLTAMMGIHCSLGGPN